MQIKPRTMDPSSDAAEAAGKSIKLSVNVASDTGNRLRRIAYGERLSESSIVQIALTLMFDQMDDATVGTYLRQQGASLRRG
jgi:hypothetical protein